MMLRIDVRSTWRRWCTSAIAAGALFACTEPTVPRPVAESSPVPLEVASSAIHGDAAIPEFNDIVERILPAFDDRRMAMEIESQLALIVAAKVSNDVEGARTAIATARKLLSESEAHPATIGAIRLALQRSQPESDGDEARQ